MAPLFGNYVTLPWDAQLYVPENVIIKHNIAAFYYMNRPSLGDTVFFVEIKANVEAIKKIFSTITPFDVMWQCLGRKQLIVDQVDNDRDLELKVELNEGLKSSGGYIRWLAESFGQEFIKLVRKSGDYNIFLQISETH